MRRSDVDHPGLGLFEIPALGPRPRPDVFVAVDGSSLTPECPIALDGRPGIRSKDRAATYDQGLFLDLCWLSADAGVVLQPVVLRWRSERRQPRPFDWGFAACGLLRVRL